MTIEEKTRLLNENMERIQAIVQQYVTPSELLMREHEWDDFYQEGYIAFLSACDSYDPENPSHANLMTYANYVIRNHLLVFFRNAKVGNTYKDVSLQQMSENSAQGEVSGASDMEDIILYQCSNSQEADVSEVAEQRIMLQNISVRLNELKNHKSKTIRIGADALLYTMKFGDRKGFSEKAGVSQNYVATGVLRVQKILKEEGFSA